MKIKLLPIIILLFSIVSNTLYSKEYKVFHTSVCYDLLSSIENSKKIIQDSTYFPNLRNDTLFIQAVENINSSIRASNLCNLYSSVKADRNNIAECIAIFSNLTPDKIPVEYQGKWLDNIFKVQEDLFLVLNRLYSSGYETYWKEKVQPILQTSIQNYKIKDGLLENIHTEINLLAGSDSLSSDYSKIYIVDIDNAFSLIDETFCCTYHLLNEEIAKQYRINFIQVYIHENLHRLYLSPKLLEKLNNLTIDDFYNMHEQKAMEYGEGKNEAFVVAAETYISHKLGLKTKEDVYKEFTEYVDGHLVLAPIVYSYIKEKKPTDSFNEFLLELFKEEKISAGKIKEQYDAIIKQLI